MDKFNLDTTERRRIDNRSNFDIHEGVIMSLPNFSTIERFLIVGGGKSNDIYDRMMSIAFHL